jgi:hypothetical protein
METNRMQSATYVYGVAPAGSFGTGHPPVRAPGIGGNGTAVRMVEFEDLVAVVSDVPESRFTLTRENILEHQRVLDEVLHRADVLPFSFGTVAGSDEEVRDLLLRQGYEALHEQLEYVRGCVELELKVFWQQDRLFAEILQENEDVRAMRDAIAMLADEDAAAAKISLGQLTEAEKELKTDWEAERLLDVLEPIAVEVLVSPNVTDTMLLNASILVERTREKDFDAAVYALGDAHVGRLIFNYVGPLPPYSFINLALETGQ